MKMQNYRIKKITIGGPWSRAIYIPQHKTFFVWRTFYKEYGDRLEYATLLGAARFIEDIQKQTARTIRKAIRAKSNKRVEYFYPPFPKYSPPLDANGLPSHEEMQKGGVWVYDKGTMV